MFYRFFATVVLWVAVSSPTQIVARIVKKNELKHQITLDNGFTFVSYNRLESSIDRIAADFSGEGLFGEENLLAAPLSFVVTTADPVSEKSGDTCKKITSSDVEWLEKYSTTGSFRVTLIYDQSFTLSSDGGCRHDEYPASDKELGGLLISERWTVSLSEGAREVSIAFEGNVLRGGQVVSALHGLYLRTPSIYGLFDRGVTQMKDNVGACLGSSEPLSRVYSLGNGGAIDVLYGEDIGSNDTKPFSSSATAAANVHTVVLRSSGSTPYITSGTGGGEVFQSGFEDVVLGDYPDKSLDYATAWSHSCWEKAVPVDVEAGTQWSYTLRLVPNNYDFPVYMLNDVAQTNAVYSEDFDVLRSRLTGIYASPAGCLQSYYANRIGTIAPTIAAPEVGYSPDTNFFDPDNFISLSALLYSGDSYLVRQVREVLLRTAETMCGIGSEQVQAYCGLDRQTVRHELFQMQRFPHRLLSSASDHTVSAMQERGEMGQRDSIAPSAETSTIRASSVEASSRMLSEPVPAASSTRAGQLMHHFIDLVPTYESIAGSEQLGPNIFWTLCAFRYVALTQDMAFAEHIFPYVDLSTRYMLTFYDADIGLLSAPGPLWIDVLVRENYTSDSNAMIVPLLRQTAEFYELLEVDPDFAASLRDIADVISRRVVELLWDDTSNDHFITQLNPDGSTRDFIDYDANLIAVAFGVLTDTDKVRALLSRVDSGPYTHVRGTWCCELPYSGDAEDCYIVGGDVCGDSVVTLARIGWVDALARKVVRDEQTFAQLLLAPLQQDLMSDVWLFERYDANGTQIRTANYFEYPAFVAMMQWEVLYGVEVGLKHVTVDPLPYKPFSFLAGDVGSNSRIRIKYSADLVELTLPGAGGGAGGDRDDDAARTVEKAVSVHGLTPTAQYSVSSSCQESQESQEGSTVAQMSSAPVSSDADGVLTFTASFAQGCTVTAKRLL